MSFVRVVFYIKLLNSLKCSSVLLRYYIVKATENAIRLFVKYLAYLCWWPCRVQVGIELVGEDWFVD
jgi:hypothetical protein